MDTNSNEMLKRVKANHAHIGIFLRIPRGVKEAGVGNEFDFLGG
jgi:hypothetical protein